MRDEHPNATAGLDAPETRLPEPGSSQAHAPETCARRRRERRASNSQLDLQEAISSLRCTRGSGYETAARRGPGRPKSRASLRGEKRSRRSRPRWSLLPRRLQAARLSVPSEVGIPRPITGSRRSDHPMITRWADWNWWRGRSSRWRSGLPTGERRSLRADDGWPLRPDRVPRLKPYPEATDLGRAVTGGAAICRIVETAHSVTVVATRTLSIASSPVTSAAIPVTSAASPSSEAIAR